MGGDCVFAEGSDPPKIVFPDARNNNTLRLEITFDMLQKGQVSNLQANPNLLKCWVGPEKC